MKENEALEILQNCLPIYNNLHDKVRYTPTTDEIKWLDKLKVIWSGQLGFEEERIIAKAGMGIEKFAFLGGYLHQEQEKDQLLKKAAFSARRTRV